MTKSKPNIILITTDQQNLDTLGINGNSMIHTPNLDVLGTEGVNFTNAHVQNTVCVPSRACIQTGRYTHQHGVTYMESVVDNTPGLPVDELTFMEHLQRHGYATGATGKIHMYPEKGFDWHNLTGGKGHRWLFAEGSALGPGPLGPNYAEWLEERRKGAYEGLYASRRSQESYQQLGVMDIPLSKEEYIEYWIADQSIEFINQQTQTDDPFFLWCGFCGPHSPFDPPEPYKSLYAADDVPLPVELDGWPSWRTLCNEDLMRRCVAYYWAMVTCIDDYVGKIINSLKDAGIYENTLIIFTSDHGEMLGERGRMGKGVFYDRVMNVPLIIKPPATETCLAGTTGKLTEVMNIAPTILDYAGVEKPETMTATSLRNIVENRVDDTYAIFSEYVTNDKSEVSKCVRTDTHKYICHFLSQKEEFYDLVNDPLEQYNLADTSRHYELMCHLKDRMLTWLATTEILNNY